ncbi:MAG: dihydrolipoyl dehydrogenase [Cryomorphaceae bacterium]|nr:dihydrolipoyl dehydrogenase [Cryomorphaceae bacterium]
MTEYDLVVIGSGPGGYVCAIRAAQLGMKTALIEKYNALGGTCLNVGCIPSKALLDSSHHFHSATHEFADHGIDVGTPKADLKKMIERKAKVVSQTVDGIKYLMDKNKIDVYHGLGSFEDDHTVKISGEKEEVIKGKNIVIATGSKPSSLPFIKLDKERIITSTEALELQEIPKHMIVIGGGVIGVELGSVYARLGAKVSVVEFLDGIVPSFDKDISKELLKSMKKLGVKFHLSTKVTAVERKGKNITIIAEDKKGAEVKLEGDICLVSIGRRAYTDGLNLAAAGLTTNDRGQVEVDDHNRTKKSHIYAIGDVVRGAMLAHKAEEEGVYVAEIINGEKPHIDHNLIPNVVYTWPEVASVGKGEEALKAEGRDIRVGSFPMRALGRSRASGDIAGMVKIIVDAKTDEILGAQMIGARAADLIAEAVVAMEFRASAEDIARMSHAHPTYSEAVKEAALAATANRALHI